jgi:hypothetical protein
MIKSNPEDIFLARLGTNSFQARHVVSMDIHYEAHS